MKLTPRLMIVFVVTIPYGAYLFMDKINTGIYALYFRFNSIRINAS